MTGERLRQAADIFAIVILLAVAAVAALTFRDYGLGWDDFTHAQYGDLLLAYYGSGLRDQRALHFVNLYYYGGGFDMAAALLAKALPLGLFETRRLCGAIVGILGLIATWRIARRAGGPLAGVVGLALLASCPLYIGHMYMNAKDAPFAAAMALLILALMRICDEYPKPSAGAVIMFGIGLGLAFGSRVLGVLSALYLLPALALIVWIEARRGAVEQQRSNALSCRPGRSAAESRDPLIPEPAAAWVPDRAFGASGTTALETGTTALRHAAGRFGHLVLRLLPGLVLAYAVMALVWPWSVVNPLDPILALEYFSRFFEKPWQELFGGVLISAPDMPRRYVPTLLALKLPELMLALGTIGLVGAFVAAARRAVPLRRRAMLLTLALAAVVPVAITVMLRPAMYNGIRHFLFVLPALAALGGLAAAWIIDWLRTRRLALALAAAVLAIGLISPIVEMVRLHPYEYTSFNHVAGGVRGAAKNYMLDYWGLSFKQASQALLDWLAARDETPPKRQWTIAVCGPHPPAEVALGPRFEATWDAKGADFAMMLGTFYCAKLDAPVIAEIAREGVPYATVYDIRGRDVGNILTQPPP
jgi:hypothetical protein